MKDRKWWRFSGIETSLAAASVGAMVYGLAYAATQPHAASSSWGLAEGQTARLTVTNLADGSVAPNPCGVQLKIYAADGSVLKVSQALKIDAGASAWHDLKFSDLQRGTTTDSATGGGGAGRFQLRAAAFMLKLDSNGAGDTSCADHKVSQFYKMSVEVLDDSTGRTSFSVPVFSDVPAVQDRD